MTWDRVITAVDQQLPQFNKDLLVDYKRRNIDSSKDFLAEVFMAAIAYINNCKKDLCIEYIGYEVVSPVDQLRCEFGQKIVKDQFNINADSLRLVEYRFNVRYKTDNGGEISKEQTTRLYLPFWPNTGIISIGGVPYYVKHVLSDIIVRTSDNGIIVKVIRSPLQFWRNNSVILKDINGKEYPTTMITLQAHYRKSNKKTTKPPMLLYLLAEYGFDLTMKKMDVFGRMDFVSEPVDDGFSIFFEILPNLYFRVDGDVMGETRASRVVAPIVSMLQDYADDTRACMNDIKDVLLYRVILGKMLYGRDVNAPLAQEHAISVVLSLKTYLDQRAIDELDPTGKNRLNDVYDLFIYVSNNIDMWLVNYSCNDLFEKRLEGINKILYFLVCNFFTRFYDKTKNKNLQYDKVISTALQIPFNSIHKIKNNDNEHLDIVKGSYNDNILFTLLVDKLRQSKPSSGNKSAKKGGNKSIINAPEHQFHPSFVAIESILSIPKSNPGIAGDINPFVIITPSGNFDKKAMTWYKQAEDMKKYLSGR
jgi:hypothetical protein